MSSGRDEDLDRAVATLERLARRGGRPDRYLVRGLLVPLGRRLEGSGQETEALLERIRRAAAALGGPWEEACQTELSLACAEHVHAVDPRFLTLPDYDFGYTLAARERLEARLRAARALEIPLPASLLAGVRRADALLAPHVARRTPEGPPEPPASPARESRPDSGPDEAL